MKPNEGGVTGGLRRREVLGLLGAGTVGLAGCTGGGGSGGGGDTTRTASGTPSRTATGTPTRTATSTPTTQGDGGSEPAFCGKLADGYTRYDESESPFVATFEHPGDVAATGTFNDEHSLTVRVNVEERQPFDIFPTQNLSGTDSLTPAQKGELDGLEQFDELDFGGETVPLVRASAGSNGDDGAERYTNYPYYVVGLPYEGSAGKKYYRFDVRATVRFADSLEPTVCEPTYRTVAKHVLGSLEPNPDTTVESEGV